MVNGLQQGSCIELTCEDEKTHDKENLEKREVKFSFAKPPYSPDVLEKVSAVHKQTLDRETYKDDNRNEE